MISFKQQVYIHFQSALSDKITALQQVLADLKASASNETKSTAGDKHETALAMLQIEQANKRNQLKELLAQKVMLDMIQPHLSAPMVCKGSLVKTNRGYLYISEALGKAMINEVLIIAISPQSPLGAKMLHLVVGDTAEVNGNLYSVESIS